MTLDRLLALAGLGEIVAEDLLFVQIAVLGATALLFLASLVLSALAFRAAGTARKARVEAAADAVVARDLAVEIRRLTAQTELAAKRLTHRPIPIGAGELVPEPTPESVAETQPVLTNEQSVEAIAPLLSPTHGQFADEWTKDSGKSLEAAREAASVPKSLLGSWGRKSA